jgi:hypothetical protein
VSTRTWPMRSWTATTTTTTTTTTDRLATAQQIEKRSIQHNL